MVHVGQNVNGRTVTLIIDPEPDEFGQFKVVVRVDGKTRWGGYFTDRSWKITDPTPPDRSSDPESSAAHES